MNSELTSQLTASATESETVLGESFAYNGSSFTGVFGAAQVAETMIAAGGYRRRAVVPLTVTKTQTDFVPVSKATLTRTDTGITYRIEHFNSHDALHFVLLLVKVGE